MIKLILNAWFFFWYFVELFPRFIKSLWCWQHFGCKFQSTPLWLFGLCLWSELVVWTLGMIWSPEILKSWVHQASSGAAAFRCNCIFCCSPHSPCLWENNPIRIPLPRHPLSSPPTPQTPSHPHNGSTTPNHFMWGDWISAVLNKNIVSSHVNQIWGNRTGGSKVSVASPNNNSLDSHPSAPSECWPIPPAASNPDDSDSSHHSVPAWSRSAFPFHNVHPLLWKLGSVHTWDLTRGTWALHQKSQKRFLGWGDGWIWWFKSFFPPALTILCFSLWLSTLWFSQLPKHPEAVNWQF